MPEDVIGPADHALAIGLDVEGLDKDLGIPVQLQSSQLCSQIFDFLSSKPRRFHQSRPFFKAQV